jgi:hypothetical protein
MPGPGRELINLLDGQLARVRYALIADVLLIQAMISPFEPWAVKM